MKSLAQIILILLTLFANTKSNSQNFFLGVGFNTSIHKFNYNRDFFLKSKFSLTQPSICFGFDSKKFGIKIKLSRMEQIMQQIPTDNNPPANFPIRINNKAKNFNQNLEADYLLVNNSKIKIKYIFGLTRSIWYQYQSNIYFKSKPQITFKTDSTGTNAAIFAVQGIQLGYQKGHFQYNLSVCINNKIRDYYKHFDDNNLINTNSLYYLGADFHINYIFKYESK